MTDVPYTPFGRHQHTGDMPDRHARCRDAALPVLTPRSSAAEPSVRPQPGPQPITADAPEIDLRLWGEIGAGFLPSLAWLVAGITDTPRLAVAAYIGIAIMLAIRPQLGYLALLPILTFNHAQGFPPHGPIFLLTGIGLASVLLRWSLGLAHVPRSVRPAMWCSLAFLAVTAFQLVLGVSEFGRALPLRALSQYDQIFIILSVFAMGLVVLPGRPQAPYLVAYLASFAIVAGVALVHFAAPGWLAFLRLNWMVHPSAFDYRASGVIANPNFLGLVLACGLAWIVVTAIWQILRGRVEVAAWLVAAIPVAGLALILTFSRAAIVALGVGLIAALARRSLRAAGVLSVAAVIAALLVYPLFVQVRLGQTFGEASPAGEAAFAESDRLRSEIAESAVRAFLDAPIAGHGFATFREISPTYSGQSVLTSAHSLYLKVAAEQGLIGLALLGALLVSIVLPMWRAGLGPWIASLAVAFAFIAFSLTADTLGSAQAMAGAFFLMAAGVAQAGFTREQVLASQRRARAPDEAVDADPSGGRTMQ